MKINILGINEIGLESGNEGMTMGRELPWCQPETGQNIWTLWQVEYRDVFIVGPGNEHVGTFNLTVHDLSNPDHYADLRDQLLAAADDD